MRLLGRSAEAAVRAQNPDAPAERPAGRLLAIEAGRPIPVGDEDGQASVVADLVHPARIKQLDILCIKERKN